MKRVGHLFEKAFTPDALFQAWIDASAGKRGNDEAIASCLGHARRTASLRHMLNLMGDLP